MKSLKITFVLIIFIVSNLTAQNLSIKVDLIGKGDPVLLLPGFTCPGDVWEETVTEISANNECHVVSYPGFVGVPAVDTLWLSTVKTDIERYIREQKLNNVRIVGHSMGGTLALWMASEQNQHLKSIFVVDALPCMGAVMIPNYSSDQIQYNSPYNKNLLKMDENAFGFMAANYAQFMCSDSTRQKQLLNWMKQADRKTYVYGYTDLLKLDLREAMANIEIEVNVLAATLPNRQMIEQNYTKQYAPIKKKTISYVDNSAHFIMFDQFNTYIQHLKQYLN